MASVNIVEAKKKKEEKKYRYKRRGGINAAMVMRIGYEGS